MACLASGSHHVERVAPRAVFRTLTFLLNFGADYRRCGVSTKARVNSPTLTIRIYMTYRVRRKLTAWLGLIAMCLVAFAPTISHFVRAERVVAVPICTADGAGVAHRLMLLPGSMPGISSMAGLAVMTIGTTGAEDMHGMHGHQAPGSQPMDDCGYCDLLNHAPAMPTLPPAPLAPLLLLFSIFVLPALTRFTPLGAFPSGRPRAPPAIS